MGKLINGKEFADNLCKKIATEVTKLKDKSIKPGLAVVRVGEDPASAVYVNMKAKKTEEVGMHSVTKILDENTSQEDLLKIVEELNKDDAINGILVQLPLPKQINEDAVINSINPDKDVDGFHAINTGRLWSNIDSLVPCTPLGCKMLLLNELKDLTGKKAIIVGRSNIVGKPMASLLIGENCTVTVAHSKTKDLEGEVKKSDIVVAAVGVPEMVKGSWIKPGATVIDVGINRIERDGKKKLVGDVEFIEAEKIAGAITPVPGGVGPMTIACLLHNTLIATCRRHNIEVPRLF
ncbi:MAG: Bifunctional protein FolD protein [Alphaproteobacteria bacterium MarineAlpha6_Bin4]|nr:MAG: Bifunctional protein FolD protein [Alphaproteobacteria bacterium MarineAlpha6_Bin3]PPR37451.1 MAG: Bifunctional protein FolD protein [Alphaproteobacteria bacterium MarineAlpha6_Bin4]